MTNFSMSEFETLWAIVEEKLNFEWCSGRGRKSSTSSKDAFMTTLGVLKHYDNRDKHAMDLGEAASF